MASRRPNGPPPNPVHVRADLEFIRDRILDDVLNEYRWAYNLGWGKVERGDIKTRSTSHSDPTQNIAIGQSRVRAATRGAAEKIEHARNLLQSAQDDLARAHRLNDANHIMEEVYTPSDFNDPRPRDDSITKRELREAQEAQRRRQERGEGWGVA